MLTPQSKKIFMKEQNYLLHIHDITKNPFRVESHNVTKFAVKQVIKISSIKI